MPQIYVIFPRFKEMENSIGKFSNNLNDIGNKFTTVTDQLDWNVKGEEDIFRLSKNLSSQLSEYQNILSQYQKFLSSTYDTYVQLDNYNEEITGITGSFSSGGSSGGVSPSGGILSALFGKDGLFSLAALGAIGSTDVGKLYNLFKDILNGKSFADLIRSGLNLGDFLKNAAVKFKNYRRIGNAIGTGKATANWLKNVTGLRKVGRVSTAKNPIQNFKNNLTNKTSPFNLKDSVGDLMGKNGGKAAAAGWAGVVASAGLNFLDNKDEQANSGGTMSDGRVVAETVTETAVTTAAATLGTAAAGAGVASVCTAVGIACPPAIVVSLGTGLVLGGINAGVEHFTGKPATEWASDFIVDTGENISRAVGDAVSGVKNTFSKVVGLVMFK